MDIEQLKQLLVGKPEELIACAENVGLDIDSMPGDIGRIAAKKFSGISDKDIEAVDFLFWFAYTVERMAEDLIIHPEVKVGAREEMMVELVAELSLGSKISLIEKLHTGKKDKMVSLMRRIQNYRNDIAHGRFENLQYKGFHFSDNRAKMLILGHLRDATLKKGL